MKTEFEIIVFTNTEYWQEDWEVKVNAYGTVYQSPLWRFYIHACFWTSFLKSFTWI